jgi:hypothetical protein
MEIKAGQDITTNFAVVRQRLLETGVVEDAALAGHATLMGGNTDNGFTWAGKPTDLKVSIGHRNVSAEYTTVSGMVLSAGRNFISNTASEGSNIIINESMARLMGNGSAIGQVIRSRRDNEKGVLTDMTIVGVVKRFCIR